MQAGSNGGKPPSDWNDWSRSVFSSQVTAASSPPLAAGSGGRPVSSVDGVLDSQATLPWRESVILFDLLRLTLQFLITAGRDARVRGCWGVP